MACTHVDARSSTARQSAAELGSEFRRLQVAAGLVVGMRQVWMMHRIRVHQLHWRDVWFPDLQVDHERDDRAQEQVARGGGAQVESLVALLGEPVSGRGTERPGHDVDEPEREDAVDWR